MMLIHLVEKQSSKFHQKIYESIDKKLPDQPFNKIAMKNIYHLAEMRARKQGVKKDLKDNCSDLSAYVAELQVNVFKLNENVEELSNWMEHAHNLRSNRANCHAYLGDYEQSIADCSYAIELCEDNPMPYLR